MLCRVGGGGLVKIRLDMLSDRPHAMTDYSLQGAEGCCESARAEGERDRVWLRSRSRDPNEWTGLAEFEAEFLPVRYREPSGAVRASGHGGGDHFVMADFIDAALGRSPPAVGIDAAMDVTLPGLASQQSIMEDGRWVDVPDSRTWREQPGRARDEP